MKRLVSILCATAFVISGAGCSPSPTPQSRPEPAPAGDASTKTVDPGTALAVVSGGLDVAIKLKTLFGGGDGSSGEIKRRLREIQRQNTEIIRRLGEVLEILNNLGVIVQSAVREELQVHIRTTLNSNFQLFYETWAAELDDPRARETAYLRYQRDILPAIRPLARQIASPDVYGYGQFDTVGQAMFVETWIARRIREPLAFRRQGGAFYAGYFTQVLDPQAPQSLGFQLRLAQERQARLKAILDAADQAVTAGYTTTTRDTISSRTCRGGRIVVTALVSRTVKGSQATGYTVEVGPRRDQREERTCEPPEHPCPMCKALTDLTDPVDNGDRSAAGRARYWNAVREVHADVSATVAILSKSADTANVYLTEARRVAASG